MHYVTFELSFFVSVTSSTSEICKAVAIEPVNEVALGDSPPGRQLTMALFRAFEKFWPLCPVMMQSTLSPPSIPFSLRMLRPKLVK
jgi:hypothetical protein